MYVCIYVSYVCTHINLYKYYSVCLLYQYKSTNTDACRGYVIRPLASCYHQRRLQGRPTQPLPWPQEFRPRLPDDLGDFFSFLEKEKNNTFSILQKGPRVLRVYAPFHLQYSLSPSLCLSLSPSLSSALSSSDFTLARSLSQY